MKLHLVRILTAVLALALALIPALAGADTVVSIADNIAYNRGTATISWTTTGTAPSTCHVFAQAYEHGSSDQALIYLGETSASSIQTTELAPEVTYMITVLDGDMNILGLAPRRMPTVPDFEDGKLKNTSVKVNVSKRVMSVATQKFSEIQILSGAKIASSFETNQEYYGVKYQMRMPQLATAREFFVTLVFESPNGFVYVDRATDVTFDRVNNGYQTLWWELTGVDFFYNLVQTTGAVPAGTYTIRLYWDGMYVNTRTFDVGK